MSSLAIRNWFRTELVSRVPTVPYKDTVNKDPNPKNLPDVWMTLEFATSSERRISLGNPACWREFGEVQIIVLGKSGLGDTAVLTAAEAVRAAFQNVREQISLPGGGNGSLVFDADTPNTDATENGNWFLASVSCSYTLDTVR